MNAEEVRQYAKELQEENKEARALGPLNKLLMWWCIHQVNREIRRSVKQGFDYYMAVFTVNAPHALKDLDKLFLADYYKSQGYHVELRSGSMDISWAVVSPWWYTANDTTKEGS